MLCYATTSYADKIVHCAPVASCIKNECVQKGGINTDELTYSKMGMKADGNYILKLVSFGSETNARCIYFFGEYSVQYNVIDVAHAKPDLSLPYGKDWFRSGVGYSCKKDSQRCRFIISQ